MGSDHIFEHGHAPHFGEDPLTIIALDLASSVRQGPLEALTSAAVSALERSINECPQAGSLCLSTVNRVKHSPAADPCCQESFSKWSSSHCLTVGWAASRVDTAYARLDSLLVRAYARAYEF